MKVTIQQQINELTAIKASLYSAINAACTAHSKPTIPSAQQGNFNYYATHIYTNLCSGDTPTPKSYSITATSNNINMGTANGGGTYNEGTSVTLTATPNNGYKFVKWTKDGVQKSTSATYTFTAGSSTAGEYVANFAVSTYTVTATSSDSNMGTVSVNPGTVSYGGSTTLTATLIDSNTHKFLGWRKGSATSYVSTDNPYTVTNVTANASYTGVFAERTGSFKVTISGGTGSVTYKVNGDTPKTVSSGQTYNVPKDSTVTLTASASSGSTFVGWSDGSSSTDATITFSAVEGTLKTFTAKFQSEQPDRVTILYHLCTPNDSCGDRGSFKRSFVMENLKTLGSISTYLNARVSDYRTEEIADMSQMYATESFTNAVIFLIPKGYEINKAQWIPGAGEPETLTFVNVAENTGEYGYLFPPAAGDPEYYTYNNKQYTVYIGIFGADVNGVKYKIGKI